ncbi:tRNA (adenosine(37)-N6)-dimethylallyltransferase MiaA [Salibacterium aidingense]|uniref:tRNA (adenosine(37)-N6)-dimethylallyltransferase MiaA n=1 Tax=Salibacterium aidingense TaxID=384933 RepID=UPI00042A5E1F|nr:tRNA (adenosine(37)-N6)-dimethylallyltransferase MiaA [Salibacterium aidingense]
MKEKVVVIAGPTAVGKSEAGIKLASHFQGEIISGDSMQIYKGLDIGTAKVSKEERAGIPHYLIDECEPDDSFSASAFKEAAQKRIEEINQRGKLPFIVGGTGFYIQSVLRNLDFHDAPSDEEFRNKMETYVRNHGRTALHEKLKQQDEESARSIHPNNTKKVIRALEIRHVTGKTKQPFARREPTTFHYDHIIIGLTMDRNVLYSRINERVDKMVEAGLVEEAKWLYDHYPPNVQAAQAIGYKEFFPYFRGDCSLEEAAAQLKKNSRHYAKRQLTWFRNKEEVEWFDMTAGPREEKIEKMIRWIEGKYK